MPLVLFLLVLVFGLLILIIQVLHQFRCSLELLANYPLHVILKFVVLNLTIAIRVDFSRDLCPSFVIDFADTVAEH